MRLRMLLILFIIGILLTGCLNPETSEVQNDTEMPSTSEPIEPVSEDDSTQEEKSNEQEDLGEETVEVVSAEEKANTVVQTLKEKDMSVFSDYVHPTKGVRFSPYSHVDKDKDLVFTAEDVKQLMTDETVYTWGVFDGSGEPIEMTFAAYYERFVYDEDYVNAEEVSVNEQLGQGNTIDNSQEVYPNAKVVEYHFSGFDPEYAGMDWRSLRVVLEHEGDEWFVVAIIHDEWTI